MKKLKSNVITFILVITGSLSGFAQETDLPSDSVNYSIVGGDNAVPESYPWMVSLTTTTGEAGCGASLIRPQWVLTAGHCIIDFPGFPAVDGVIINSVIIDVDALEPFSENISVVETFTHEDYAGPFGGGSGPDICLIRLSEPSTITPVELATFDDASYFDHGMPAQVLGWGKTVPGGSSVDSLLHADCIFMSDDTCAELSSFSSYNSGGNICAGFFEGMTPGGAAQGDSGGPLFFEDGAGEYKQVGVVSGGDSDATTSDSPGVFTLVPKYIDWIENTIANYELAASIEAENREDLSIVTFANDRVEISGLSDADQYYITVYSVSGELTNEILMTNESNTMDINIADYQSGMYVVRVLNQSSGEVTVEKFVVL